MKIPTITDTSIEHMVSVLLRAGVVISGVIVFSGGIYYLARHGDEIADHRTFHCEPSIDRIVGQIVAGAVALRGRSIIQLGLLLLIATPIARVAVSLVAFALERDRTYVVITAIVLTILLYSLINGALEG
ncbi:MAG: DUF1634 domain-containing protein [Bryobacteraceae bacterium]